MAVKFLSKEWADEFNTRAAAGNTAPYRGKKATILNVVADAPDGEGASIIMGDVSDPEVTMSQAYEIGAAINRGELDGQKAFMQGKVKINGKMIKMMQLRGALSEVSTVLSTIDTEY